MNNTFTILEGNWLDVAKQIPDASVHCCVTSPPYYGLRAYGTEPQVWLEPSNQLLQDEGLFNCEHTWIPIKQYKDSWRRGEVSADHHSGRTPTQRNRTPQELHDGRWTCTEYCESCNAWRGELGQEPSPALYIAHLVQIFSEVWRVLRTDGTLWVNIGDAHYNYRPGKHDDARAQGYNRETNGSARDIPSFTAKRGYKIPGLKEKDLIGLPWMLAFAMRDWGWYWRSEIHWSKPNPLSESVEDRPTKSHEAILMFTKREKYFYDKWAITELPTGNAHPRFGKNGNGTNAKGMDPQSRNNASFMAGTAGTLAPGGRNKRTIWTMNLQGYADKHFAAFAEELPTTCIKAGTSEVGCCRACAAPWKRIVLKPEKACYANETLENRWRRAAALRGIDIDNAVTGESITLGWQRQCACYSGAPVPCAVLDPFLGRGTTGVVAVRFGRNFVGAELNGKYIKMIRRNLQGEQPLWVTERSAVDEASVPPSSEPSIIPSRAVAPGPTK